MAECGLSLPVLKDLLRSSLGSFMPAAPTHDLSSASGHHMTLPKMPHVMMPELALIADTMPLRCACIYMQVCKGTTALAYDYFIVP